MEHYPTNELPLALSDSKETVLWNVHGIDIVYSLALGYLWRLSIIGKNSDRLIIQKHIDKLSCNYWWLVNVQNQGISINSI